MADKNITPVEDVDVSDLDKISGGSLDNVNYTDTEDISDDTKVSIK